ncbi:MAG: insulinase family protein [Spirochaetia bacterium]|nr:insulinase family protein [Spirochaetia bacterium]
MKKKYFLKLFLTLLIFINGSLFSSDDKTESNIDINKLKIKFSENIQKYTLKNGLRIILMKNGFTPTISAYLKVGIGSSNEPFDQAGTAHFLEHLLFKGTDILGTTNYEKEKYYLKQIEIDGERIDKLNKILNDPLLTDEEIKTISKELETIKRRHKFIKKASQKFILSEEDSKAYSLAGEVGYNAYTSMDVTNYQIKLPKNRLELWAWIESRRFIKPVFREFYSERDVILEERKMRYDSKPNSLLYELFLKTAFGMSPYGKPVIGFKSNINRLKMSETMKFFEDNYIPSRMVIAIVGDIEFEPVYELLKKYFEKIPRKEEPEFPPIEFEKQLGKKTAVLTAENTPYLITGWHKPDINHADDIVFEVLEKLLTDGQTSRLTKRLVLDEKLASYVSAYNGNPGKKLANNFTIFTGPYLESSYDKIQEIIKDEIKKLADEGPTEKELEKIKNNVLADFIHSLASNSGLADSLTYYELLMNDYNKIFYFIENLQNVNKEDIQRIIKEYITEKNNTTVYIQNPQNN